LRQAQGAKVVTSDGTFHCSEFFTKGEVGGAADQRVTPLLLEQRLQRGTGAVQANVLAGGRHELDAGGQTVFRREPHGQSHAGNPGEVGRDGGRVVEVHGQRVFELLPQLERGGRRCRADQHVGLLEGRVEVALDERAYLLGAAVVG